jgi:putative copper resistance protein D
VVRWAQFTGLLVVIGAVAFRLLVLAGVRRRHPQSAALNDATARALGLARAGALLLALTSVARFVAQRAAMRDASTAPPGMQMEVAMLRTWWGEAWVGQSVAVAMLLVGLALARRRPAIGWGVAAVATVLVAISVASSGHAAASTAPFSVVFDALHLLAAGGWMGGLFVLLAAGLPAVRSGPEAERRTTMASMVNGFSTTALAFAGVVVFTGVNAAWRNVETSSALFGSAYGRVLLVKLAALAVAALVGLYNWRRARPALAVTGDDAAIRRAMRAELAAGVVILLVTAVLVALPTPVDLVRMR